MGRVDITYEDASTLARCSVVDEFEKFMVQHATLREGAPEDCFGIQTSWVSTLLLTLPSPSPHPHPHPHPYPDPHPHPHPRP